MWCVYMDARLFCCVPGQISGLFGSLSTLFTEVWSQTNPELTDRASLAIELALGIPSLCFFCVPKLETSCQTTQYLVGSEESDLQSSLCTAITLTTEASPQTLHRLFCGACLSFEIIRSSGTRFPLCKSAFVSPRTRDGPQSLHILGKQSATELHPLVSVFV